MSRPIGSNVAGPDTGYGFLIRREESEAKYECIVPLPAAEFPSVMTVPRFLRNSRPPGNWRKDGITPYDRYGRLCV